MHINDPKNFDLSLRILFSSLLDAASWFNLANRKTLIGRIGVWAERIGVRESNAKECGVIVREISEKFMRWGTDPPIE